MITENKRHMDCRCILSFIRMFIFKPFIHVIHSKSEKNGNRGKLKVKSKSACWKCKWIYICTVTTPRIDCETTTYSEMESFCYTIVIKLCVCTQRCREQQNHCNNCFQ